jgi:hypothetical protein
VKQLLPSARLVLGTAAAAAVASLSVAVSTPATMSVDGQRIVADVAPVTTVGGAYLPIRAISEATGGTTAFDEASRTVTVRRGHDVLTLKLGERQAVINGRHVTLARAPFTVRGRAMVPSSVIADAFGSSVRYDPRQAKVDVRTPGVIVAPFPDDAP